MPLHVSVIDSLMSQICGMVLNNTELWFHVELLIDNNNNNINNNGTGKFLYSAVSHPQNCSNHFTLYVPDRPVQSDAISTSLGSTQPYACN